MSRKVRISQHTYLLIPFIALKNVCKPCESYLYSGDRTREKRNPRTKGKMTYNYENTIFFYMDMGVNEHGKLSNFTLTHKGTPI